MSEKDVVRKAGTLFTADQKKTGILASVSFAQFILESGYGKSELAQNANNCFGMKTNLSGNTWGGSTWDGKSKYTKKTKEQNADGSVETITADFRKYASVEDSIADHSAYLLGAMNGKRKRYEGLSGCTDYRKAAQIIKDGGYATSLDYVDKLAAPPHLEGHRPLIARQDARLLVLHISACVCEAGEVVCPCVPAVVVPVRLHRASLHRDPITHF